jgi:hypothetical protein
MYLINIIDIFYKDNIEFISKFGIYKVLKKSTPYFTYYKLKQMFNKLIDTKILIPTKQRNIFKFNKVQKIDKIPFTVVFD